MLNSPLLAGCFIVFVFSKVPMELFHCLPYEKFKKQPGRR